MRSSDAFEERREELLKEKHADPEDRDEYAGANVFWVPKKARWAHLQANAKQAEIGKIIDEAMLAIEKDNPQLKGVLSKDYARPALDKQRLGELIDLVGTIGFGDKENRSKDILGRVYEYFLGQFASSEPGQAANLQGASAFQIYEAKWLRDKRAAKAAELEKKYADQFPPNGPAQGSA